MDEDEMLHGPKLTDRRKAAKPRRQASPARERGKERRRKSTLQAYEMTIEATVRTTVIVHADSETGARELIRRELRQPAELDMSQYVWGPPDPWSMGLTTSRRCKTDIER